MPKIVYVGKITGKFVDDVKNNKYKLNEGVVCKGVDKNNEIWMCKIKTQSWLDRLQASFGQQWSDADDVVREVNEERDSG